MTSITEITLMSRDSIWRSEVVHGMISVSCSHFPQNFSLVYFFFESGGKEVRATSLVGEISMAGAAVIVGRAGLIIQFGAPFAVTALRVTRTPNMGFSFSFCNLKMDSALPCMV